MNLVVEVCQRIFHNVSGHVTTGMGAVSTIQLKRSSSGQGVWRSTDVFLPFGTRYFAILNYEKCIFAETSLLNLGWTISDPTFDFVAGKRRDVQLVLTAI